MQFTRWQAVALVAVLALLGGGAVAFRRLRQADPRWGSKLLGQSTSTTIARAGCLLTTLTMAHNAFYKASLTPDAANERILRAGGFQGPNLLQGSNKPAQALGMVTPPEAKKLKGVDYAALAQTVTEVLSRGGIPVIHVTHDGDLTGDHFLMITKRNPDGSFTAVDPAGAADVIALNANLQNTRYVTLSVRAYYKADSPRGREILAARAQNKAATIFA